MRTSILAAALLLTCASLLHAQTVPQTMAYQGYVTDLVGSPVADGSYTFTFALYTTASGGGSFWQETHSGVAVSRGLFTVVLGSNNPLSAAFDQQYYLGIRMGGDPEMSPRVLLTAAAYSQRARVADAVRDGGVNTIALAPDAVTTEKIAPTIVASINGVTNDGGNIDLVAGTNITITPNDAANSVTISASGGGGGGLSLPYAGSIAAPDPAFKITQSGSGAAAEFTVPTPASAATALTVTSYSIASPAISATAGLGTSFRASSSGSGSETFRAANTGDGPVALFETTGGTSPAVRVEKPSGLGDAVRINNSSGGYGLAIVNDGNSLGLSIRQEGNGVGAVINIPNASATLSGLQIINNGTSFGAHGVYAHTEGGRAFYGSSSAANGYYTSYFTNSGAGGGLFVGNDANTATAVFENTTATANAKILRLQRSGGTTAFEVDREGDVNATGSVQAAAFVVTAQAGTAPGTIGRNNLVHAWARVKSAPFSVLSSYGCTVTRTGTGAYTVTFTTAFADADDVCPLVTCRQSAGNYTATVAFIAASYVTIETYNGSGTQVDCDFQVLITGVR